MNASSLARFFLPTASVWLLLIASPDVLAQGGGRGGIPNATPAQTAALGAMDQALADQTAAVNAARIAVSAATFAEPRNDADLKAKFAQLAAAELALATARAEQFTRIQSGTDKLNADQVSALVAQAGPGGRGGGGGGGRGANLDAGKVFTRPNDSPGLGKQMELPKPDAEGFISMFNGKDLTGWDALPSFWSVKDGAIDCVETSEPGGNIQSDLIWIDSREHPEKYANFELHVKFRWLSHSGNSGVQFRGVLDNPATKHIGGYQADFDPNNAYTGGIYDESGRTGRRTKDVPGPHMAPRGFKITYPADGSSGKAQPLAENAQALAAVVKPVNGDFNELVVVADGPYITVKINGHLFADMVDENPGAMKSGIIAFQQHAGPQMEIQFKDPRIKFLPAKKN